MARGDPADETERDLHKVRRHVRILVDLGRLMVETSGLGRFLDLAVIQVARAVGIDHVKVLQYRPEAGDLLVRAGIGWREGVVGAATLSADLRSPPGRSFQTGEPVVIADFSGQDDYAHSDLLKEHGIVSLVNVPVLIDGATWGVLEVDSKVAREFGRDTVDFLTAAAALVGAVVQRALPGAGDAERQASAAAEARSRDVLLREMQHRIKNNFQLILSSISLLKRRHAAEETRAALDHIAGRINAISLAHDQLAPRGARRAVRLPDYLRVLCATIRHQADRVELDVEADEIDLAIDRAVPLGLILNELVTNSVKHAFGPEGGRILVRLAAGVGHGEARLTVSDDGRGMPARAHGGMGLQLIESLARQIGATVDQESSERGTATALTFPLVA